MHRGYIKIWRKIEDSWIIQDPDAMWLWIKLLLKANHKDTTFMFNGKSLTLKRGSLITGRKSLVDKHKISESKVYRLLKLFENEQLIEQQKTNLYTIVTIVCYNDYQSSEHQIEQPVNNKRTTSEQPVNTSKELIITKNKLKRTNNMRFEEIWVKYPKMIGKSHSLRHFEATVKTDQDWIDINKALNNYIKTKEVKNGYIKNGSTWFNQWRDFVNYTDPSDDGIPEEWKTKR